VGTHSQGSAQLFFDFAYGTLFGMALFMVVHSPVMAGIGVTMKPLLVLTLSVAVFIGLSSLSAVAAPPFQVGNPRMEGSGCPTGSVQAIVSDDGSSVSILFDKFTISGVKGPNQWDLMRKSCSFRIPLSVDPGFNLDVQTIDYRGFANLANNNHAFIITTGPAVNMSDFVVGNNPVRTDIRNIVGNFTITQAVPQNGRGNCKATQSLDFATVLQLFGPNPRGPLFLVNEAQVTIDSADAGPQEAVRLRIAARPCR
jgi:hypothetical protein